MVWYLRFFVQVNLKFPDWKCHKPPDFEVEKPLQGSVSAASNNNGKIFSREKGRIWETLMRYSPY